MTADLIAAQQAEAAAAFLEAWAELLPSLPDDYACTLTCSEAESAADLLQAFGYLTEANSLMVAHIEHDQEGDAHWAVKAL